MDTSISESALRDSTRVTELMGAWLQDDYRDLLNFLPIGFIHPARTNPNYVPPDHGMAVLYTSVISMSIALMLVILRITARSIMVGHGSWEAEDYSLIVATLFAVGFTVLQCLFVKVGGLGVHVYDLMPLQVLEAYKLAFAHQVLHAVTLFFTRLCLCLFYLRLLPRTNRQRAMIFLVFAYSGACTLTMIFLYFFQCRPVDAAWDLRMRVASTPEAQLKSGGDVGNCINVQKLFFLTAALNLFGDIVVLLLPLKAVWGLRSKPEMVNRVGRVTQAVAMLLICMGGLACAFAVARICFLPQIQGNFDFTYGTHLVVICGQMEVTISIVCFCIPTLRPLLRRFTQKKVTVAQRQPAQRAVHQRPIRLNDVSSLMPTIEGLTTMDPASEEDFKKRHLDVDESEIGYSISDSQDHDLEVGRLVDPPEKRRKSSTTLGVFRGLLSGYYRSSMARNNPANLATATTIADKCISAGKNTETAERLRRGSTGSIPSAVSRDSKGVVGILQRHECTSDLRQFIPRHGAQSLTSVRRWSTENPLEVVKERDECIVSSSSNLRMALQLATEKVALTTPTSELESPGNLRLKSCEVDITGHSNADIPTGAIEPYHRGPRWPSTVSSCKSEIDSWPGSSIMTSTASQDLPSNPAWLADSCAAGSKLLHHPTPADDGRQSSALGTTGPVMAPLSPGAAITHMHNTWSLPQANVEVGQHRGNRKNFTEMSILPDGRQQG